jgi:hypothetical protein
LISDPATRNASLNLKMLDLGGKVAHAEIWNVWKHLTARL